MMILHILHLLSMAANLQFSQSILFLLKQFTHLPLLRSFLGQFIWLGSRKWLYPAFRVVKLLFPPFLLLTEAKTEEFYLQQANSDRSQLQKAFTLRFLFACPACPATSSWSSFTFVNMMRMIIVVEIS